MPCARKGCRPRLETRMDSEKILEINSKIYTRTGPEGSHVREQLVSEQRKDISVPQVNQGTNRGIEQGRDTTPKHENSP